MVIGASFIGLEVAASLRAREIEVHVVAPEKRPMERILGPDMGDLVRTLHEEKGVVFHLEDSPVAIEGKQVKLKSGGALDADLVVMGVGVRPRTALAEQAGLEVDRGVVTDTFLEIERAGHLRRRRHRAVARSVQRAGDPGRALGGGRAPGPDRGAQHAGLPRARSTPCRSSGASTTTCRSTMSATPRSGTTIEVEGDIAGKDCLVRYKLKGQTMAAASIYRDVASLEAEVVMEQETA